jgi:diacylglycerol kinase (ATP)
MQQKASYPKNRRPHPVKRVIQAIVFSLQGLRWAWKYEQAIRQEIIILFIAVAVALWLHVSPLERLLLVGSWALVIIVELLNSAVEATVDRIGIEHHKLSGRAKDIGSAAVFCAILLSFTTWLTILLG